MIFKSFFVFTGTLLSAVSILMLFITWDDIGIESKHGRVLALIIILIFSTILSIIYIFIYNKRTLWQNGSGKINVCYSDIMKKAFPKYSCKERIVVIPVNTCFDTIVDIDIASVDKPIVSPNTLHGKWIIKMKDLGITQEMLQEKIEKYISQNNIKPENLLSKDKKTRGNRLSYKKGTIVRIKGEKQVTFFLLALSEFDGENNAHCSEDEFVACIKNLIDFYNTKGQGVDMFLPIMGTNLSRIGFSHEQSLNKISLLFKLYSNKIHGNVTIIVYNKDKDKVSISNI